ncbi:hypothetical protein ABEF93_001112 [Exophiala dermatitidis]
MAVRTMPAVTLTEATSFPTAGIGGSYYDTAFGVPTYGSAVFDQTTWRLLDNWDHGNVNYASSEGLAAGLAWATLIYLLALTPSHKRTTPFHCFLLAGLVFMLLHLMINVIAALTPGLKTTTAYIYITLDIASSAWPRNCVAFNIKQIMYIGKTTALEESTAVLQLRNLYLITYAISIGSFSLVSIFSIVDIIWRRPSRVIKGHNVFASALNLVGLLCAQSFMVPFIFCILQVIPNNSGIMLPEIMLLPSVYVILPLGSLFMTVNTPDSEPTSGALPLKSAPSPGPFDRSPTLNGGTVSGSRPGSYVPDMASEKTYTDRKSVCSQLDRELNLIDSLDTLGKQEADSMLHGQGNEKAKTSDAPKHAYGEKDNIHVGTEQMV